MKAWESFEQTVLSPVALLLIWVGLYLLVVIFDV